mgnify:CR=1 FL=1
MKLRQQLLLISLLTLSLPWAGCQYIQEMESALQQGQAAALAASAQAVAARINSQPTLMPAHQPNIPAARELYAHPLPAGAIVDGYSDDWRGLEIAAHPLPVIALNRGASQDASTASGERDPFSAQVRAGSHGKYLYLFIDVSDAAISYHHPGKAALASGDHLILARGRSGQSPLEYTLSTSAPGSVNALRHRSDGRLQQDHQIKGFWRERSGGYQVELVLPLAYAQDGFGLAVINKAIAQAPVQVVGNWRPSSLQHATAPSAVEKPGRLVSPLSHLNREIAVFARPGLRLRVVDHHGWQLASAGSTASPSTSLYPLSDSSTHNLVDTSQAADQTHWLLPYIYRLVLKSSTLPQLTNREASGRIFAPEVQAALGGTADNRWYQLEQRQLSSAATPILGADQGILGAVIAEQSSDALLALTNSAFSRLVLLSMGAALLAALSLLGYASWLSWRVRRLNRAAELAVSQDGQILLNSPPHQSDHQHWPSLQARDEIGDLSRGYRESLLRLQAYTDYLKTLADKLSHELRTPLAVVRSSLDNLEHESLTEQALIYTDRARSGTERLSKLLTAMSEASRVEASIQRAEKEQFPLDELVRNMVASYRDIYPNSQILLQATPNQQGNYQYLGSPDLLAQCLDKLVDNAVDYCPDKGEIRIFLEPRGDNWQLRIENQGPLLPENMREQLFDSLVSLREGEQKARGNRTHMGLGLFIVRLVALFHGGSVSANNLADGSGVAFTVVLTNSPKTA